MNTALAVRQEGKKLFEIVLFPEVVADLDMLDDDVYAEVDSYFERLKINPLACSLPLHDLDGRDLRGYRKIYVANATYRIIIKVEQGVTKIVEVVAVGERNRMKVYTDAFARILSRQK